MRMYASLLCSALAVSAVPSAAADRLRPAEAARIATHGPWPPPLPADPSNRVFADAAAAEFGRRMFHDSRASANGYVGCVTCHQTNRAWTDAIPRAQGHGPLDRNTPTLTNVAWNRWFGWSGASDSLWMASLRPLLDEREMASTPAKMAEVVRIGIGLACEYRRAFGRSPDEVDDETVMVDVAKAIAAFQRTLVTGRTAFDDYRDALQRGDARAAALYPAAARRGLRLFVGRAGCATCHAGATFSDGGFHAVIRSPRDGGRRDAAPRLAASRYTLNGTFNDAPASTRERIESTRALLVSAAQRRDHGDVRAAAAEPARFRVPGLRNVAVTAPYMHDGSRITLHDAVRHGGGRLLPPRDVDDLVVFLHTLTDPAGASRPRQWPAPPDCH